jgi:hypothetical protein
MGKKSMVKESNSFDKSLQEGLVSSLEMFESEAVPVPAPQASREVRSSEFLKEKRRDSAERSALTRRQDFERSLALGLDYKKTHGNSETSATVDFSRNFIITKTKIVYYAANTLKSSLGSGKGYFTKNRANTVEARESLEIFKSRYGTQMPELTEKLERSLEAQEQVAEILIEKFTEHKDVARLFVKFPVVLRKIISAALDQLINPERIFKSVDFWEGRPGTKILLTAEVKKVYVSNEYGTKTEQGAQFKIYKSYPDGHMGKLCFVNPWEEVFASDTAFWQNRVVSFFKKVNQVVNNLFPEAKGSIELIQIINKVDGPRLPDWRMQLSEDSELITTPSDDSPKRDLVSPKVEEVQTRSSKEISKAIARKWFNAMDERSGLFSDFLDSLSAEEREHSLTGVLCDSTITVSIARVFLTQILAE